MLGMLMKVMKVDLLTNLQYHRIIFQHAEQNTCYRVIVTHFSQIRCITLIRWRYGISPYCEKCRA